MLRLIDEPELMAPMGQEGRRLAEERFDVRDVNRTIVEALGLVPLSATAGAGPA
jgi:hypothetical protein